MKVLIGFVLALLLALAIVLFVAYSGAVNVAASRAHLPGVEWFLETTQERSIAARADEIRVPDLSSEQMVESGAHHYRETCVTCHGAPGVPPSEIGKGLNPQPPELWHEREVGGSTAAQEFWVVSRGIRMTGMPAFGPTHSEQELWAIVAFLERLRGMSAEEYARLTAEPQHAGETTGQEADHH